jgi:hypothetical protein
MIKNIHLFIKRIKEEKKKRKRAVYKSFSNKYFFLIRMTFI